MPVDDLAGLRKCMIIVRAYYCLKFNFSQLLAVLYSRIAIAGTLPLSAPEPHDGAQQHPTAADAPPGQGACWMAVLCQLFLCHFTDSGQCLFVGVPQRELRPRQPANYGGGTRRPNRARDSRCAVIAAKEREFDRWLEANTPALARQRQHHDPAVPLFQSAEAKKVMAHFQDMDQLLLIEVCPVCKEGFPNVSSDNDVGVRIGCKRLHKHNWAVNVPRFVSFRTALDLINPFEERLMALYHPILTIYRLAFGMTALRGGVLIVPTSVREVVGSVLLPHRYDDVNVLLLRPSGWSDEKVRQHGGQLRVRGRLLEQAIREKCELDPSYRAIVNVDWAALAALPADDIVPEQVLRNHTIDVPAEVAAPAPQHVTGFDHGVPGTGTGGDAENDVRMMEGLEVDNDFTDRDTDLELVRLAATLVQLDVGDSHRLQRYKNDIKEHAAHLVREQADHAAAVLAAEQANAQAGADAVQARQDIIDANNLAQYLFTPTQAASQPHQFGDHDHDLDGVARSSDQADAELPARTPLHGDAVHVIGSHDGIGHSATQARNGIIQDLAGLFAQVATPSELSEEVGDPQADGARGGTQLPVRNDDVAGAHDGDAIGDRVLIARPQIDAAAGGGIPVIPELHDNGHAPAREVLVDDVLHWAAHALTPEPGVGQNLPEPVEQPAAAPAVRRRLPIVDEPPIDLRPVSDRTPYLLAGTFPTLFRSGPDGDPSAAGSKHFSAALEHLMKQCYYVDGTGNILLPPTGEEQHRGSAAPGSFHWPFGAHPLFAHVARQLKRRRSALSQCGVYMKQTYRGENAVPTAAELIEQHRRLGTNRFLAPFVRIQQNTPGTRAYFLRKQADLTHTIEQHGPAVLFLTLSFADCHSPTLGRLLQRCDDELDTDGLPTYTAMKANSLAYCHISAAYFVLRAENLVKRLLIDILGCSWYSLRLEYQHRGTVHGHAMVALPDAPNFPTHLNHIKRGRAAQQALELWQRREDAGLLNTDGGVDTDLLDMSYDTGAADAAFVDYIGAAGGHFDVDTIEHVDAHDSESDDENVIPRDAAIDEPVDWPELVPVQSVQHASVPEVTVGVSVFGKPFVDWSCASGMYQLRVLVAVGQDSEATCTAFANWLVSASKSVLPDGVVDAGVGGAAAVCRKYFNPALSDEDMCVDMFALESALHQHECREGTCLVRGECRHGFPFDAREETAYVYHGKPGQRRLKLMVKRDAGCEYMNCTNKLLMQTWRANTDCQIIYSTSALQKYVLKYVLKPEQLSERVSTVLRAAGHDERLLGGDATGGRRAMCKVFLAAAGSGRDTGRQEASHDLCGGALIITNIASDTVSLGGTVVKRAARQPPVAASAVAAAQHVDILDGHVHLADDQVEQDAADEEVAAAGARIPAYRRVDNANAGNSQSDSEHDDELLVGHNAAERGNGELDLLGDPAAAALHNPRAVGAERSLDLVHFYSTRDMANLELASMNLLQFCQRYHVVKGVLRPYRIKPGIFRVIRFSPQAYYKPKDAVAHAKYCMWRLIQLRPWHGDSRHAWMTASQLLRSQAGNDVVPDAHTVAAWIALMQTEAVQDMALTLLDYEVPEQWGDDEVLPEADAGVHAEEPPADGDAWMNLLRPAHARMFGDADDGAGGEMQAFGEDLPHYDRLAARERMGLTDGDVRVMLSFWKDVKAQRVTAPVELFAGNVERLAGEQLQWYRMKLAHAAAGTTAMNDILYGSAGCGKSVAIKALKFTLFDSTIVLATTGKAAAALYGETLDAAFPLHLITPTKRTLSNKLLQSLQNKYYSTQNIIIDEFGMLGTAKLAKLSIICKQIKPGDGVFGQFNVTFGGDCGQLAPVLQNPLFMMSNDPKKVLDNEGYHIFKQLVTVNWFRRNYRQERDPNYMYSLAALKDGGLTDGHIGLFATRVLDGPGNTISARDRERALSFGPDVLWAATTTEEVNAINMSFLVQQARAGAGIALSHALQPRKTARLPASDFSGIQSTVAFVDGCPVMVRRNIATNCGVVNGAIGTVVAVWYAETAGHQALPLCVFVKLSGYRGPRFPGTPLPFADDVIPIPPMRISKGTGSFGGEHVRTQVPLSVHAATTIHKTQGSTTPEGHMLVVCLGDREFSPGLAYVGLSRPSSLEQLIIAKSFTSDRLRAAHSTKYHAMRTRFEQHILNACAAETSAACEASQLPSQTPRIDQLGRWVNVEPLITEAAAAANPAAGGRQLAAVHYSCAVPGCRREYVRRIWFVDHLRTSHTMTTEASNAVADAFEVHARGQAEQ